MSLLEDRLLKIIECRERKLEDADIAREMGLTLEMVKSYEDITKKQIESALKNGRENVAKKVGLSPVVYELFVEQYNIEIPKKLHWQDRIKEKKPWIIKRLAEGAKPEDIACQMQYDGLPYISSSRYVKKMQELEELLESAEKMRKAIESGSPDLEELKRKHALPDESLVEQIRTLAEHKLTTAKIAEVLGRDYAYIHSTAKRYGIEIISAGEESASKVRALAEFGLSESEIAKELSMGLSNVRRIAKDYGIEIHRGSSPGPKLKRILKRDRLIRRGLSLGQIAEAEDVTSEAVRTYIERSKQYEKWKQSRERYKKISSVKGKKESEEERKQAIGRVLLCAQEAGLRNSPEEDEWAARKAYEYVNKYRRTSPQNYTPEILFTIFKRYENARGRGVKLSLEELGEDTDIWEARVSEILKKVGLEPMHGSQKRHTISKEKKQAIKRAVRIKMFCSDKSYFLRLPQYAVHQNIVRRGLRDKIPEVHHIKRFGYGSNGQCLNYRTASEIYEARDLFDGITRREIAELLGIREEVVEYAEENKRKIGREIKNALKILYPERKIRKPYLDF